MSDQPPGSEWNEENSADFLALADVFVPERGRQTRLVGDLLVAAWGSELERPRRLLELCCGEGLLASHMLARLPALTVEALDGSAAMRLRAAERCAAYPGRFTAEAFALEADDWRRARVGSDYDAVVSSLAIHHLDDHGKRQLWTALGSLLAPGGRLVVADLVAPAEAATEILAAAEWDAMTARQAVERDGHLAAFRRFEGMRWNLWRYPDGIDHPSTLAELLDGLRASGFAAVDVVWLAAGHVILSAVVAR